LALKLLLFDVAKGTATELVDGSYPAYSPSGHILYTAPQQSALWSVPFSLAAMKVTGEPFAVNARTRRASAARDGTIVTWTTSGGAVLTWRNSKGELLGRIAEPTQAILDIALSPDESKVAYTTEAAEIWVQELNRPIRSKLVSGRYPKWGPTASEITYYSLSNKKMMAVPADGSGEPREIGAGLPGDWTADGDQHVYSVLAPGDGASYDLWRLKRNKKGGYEASLFLKSPALETAPRLSPDAK